MIDNQQLIYLYDLPKDKITCTQISLTFKDKSGVILDSKPQIKRDLTRPFCSAMVSIKDTKQFNEACEKMRYFEIDGKPCRALPFDKQLLGSNKDKLQHHNIFVKVPKHLKHEDLHQLFQDYGKIKSLKISLNPDFTSRGYGFICYQEEASASNALQASLPDGVHPMKFEPKDRRSFRRLINNIYVKNIPEGKSNDDIKEMFQPFGNIKSLIVQEHTYGKFAFICYDDPTGQNKEYGPQCAQKAIDEMNDREIDGIKLCVKHALKKAERDIEKIRDTIRYKASKKRCNLYVKNFPNSYTRDDLMNLFKQYGEIENIRLEHGQNTKNAFAFVCFKEPTDANKAKQNLQNTPIDGKMLMINYYEIKEVRKLQMEEARDKADWEKYQAQMSGGLKWNDLTSQPHLAQMLQQLLGIIQYNESTNQQFQGELNNRHRGPRQYHNRGPRQYNQNGMGGQNMGHPGHQGGMGHPGNQGGMGQQQNPMHPGQMGQQMPPQQRMMHQQQQPMPM